MPKETGMMFKGPLVRAILEGHKTQTRRVVATPRTRESFVMLDHGKGWWPYQSDDGESELCNDGNEHPYNAPYGNKGDLIYVRETWQHANFPLGPYQEGAPTFYRADYLHERDPDYADAERTIRRNWLPSIHMPKAAARIWLEITGVRVERLQDISEADADAEGCERLEVERYERDWALCPKCGGTRLYDAFGAGLGVIHDVDCRECDTYVKRFRHLWKSTGADWDANPWVWVYDFKRIERTATA